MTKTDWFATWFDTSYYHILYKKRDDAEAKNFITNLVGALDLKEGAKVLDLACGKGRHSITLNQLGFNVLGVDLSENSIKEASKHATEGLRFGVQDMREPLDEQFDAVFNLFTSFGYFDSIQDNDRVIQAMSEMLDDNGTLVIDFMNSFKVIEQLVKKEEKEVDGIHFNIERKYTGTHVVKDIRFSADGRNHHYTETVQALLLEDFQGLLEKHGFQIESLYGNFDLDTFNKETADRLIIVAKKK